MIYRSFLSICLLAGCLILSLSCSKDKVEGVTPVPVGEPSDRERMLTNIADNMIIPTYTAFDGKLALMASKSAAFKNDPTPTSLTEFRDAWKDAYIEWQKVDLFDVGPAMDYQLRSFFNIYPVDEAKINSNITSGTANLEAISASTAQGFPALDYLINGLGETDEEILVYYTTDADAEKRFAYILKITDKMKEKLTLIRNIWTSEYRNTFITKTSMDINSSTSLLVNGVVHYYERNIRSGKFGIPSGAMLNGVKNPIYVEAYYKKDISLILAQTAHQAYVDFFNGKSVLTGTEGASFKTYLNGLDAKDSKTGQSLVAIMNAQFGSVTSKMGLLDDNFIDEVNNDNDKMVAVYLEMQKAVRLLKVDMTSAMSVTITYTDNDGD